MSQAWRFLMTGVWGICLKDISIEFMAKKQLARLKIHNIKKENPNGPLTKEETDTLLVAVNEYEEATLEFAPTWHPHSSRVTEVQEALRQYKIG